MFGFFVCEIVGSEPTDVPYAMEDALIVGVITSPAFVIAKSAEALIDA
jgi:hypothetical protein